MYACCPVLWSAVLAATARAAVADHDGQDVLRGLQGDERLGGNTAKNVVFILTDDQDAAMESMAYMPLVHKYLAAQGTTYTNHFTTTAICCPSRVSLWTGKQPHNTNVTDVNPPHGNRLHPLLRTGLLFEPQLTMPQAAIPNSWPRV